MQLELADIKARVARLDRLARGLAREVGLQKGAEDVLLFRERNQYLAAVQDAQTGPEARPDNAATVCGSDLVGRRSVQGPVLGPP
jgi:hypothetical protein